MTCVLHQLSTGDHILCCDDVYGGTQRYIRRFAEEKFKIEVDFVDMTKMENVKNGLKKNTKLVWIETPTNPMLKIIDIASVIKVTREVVGEGCLIASDNTFASPYLQNPLDLGADICV